MKSLKEIVHCIAPNHSLTSDCTIASLSFDSRTVDNQCLFFAFIGSNGNGHDFLLKAYELGCRAAVVSQAVDVPQDMQLIFVENTRIAFASASCFWFEYPANRLTLVGVTGTNGKTTTATLLHQLFESLGYKSGLISTVVNLVGSEKIPSSHTTPDAFSLNALFSKMVDQGCSHCFMEVSSHALDQFRVHGITFKGAVFTNITHDHLDYHKTFKEYLRVKKTFFDSLEKDAFALTNLDDKNGKVMLQNTLAKKVGYSLKTMSDYKANLLENSLNGLVLKVGPYELHSPLMGEFNAYNLLALFATGQLLGIPAMELLEKISNLKAVDGRFQFFKSQTGVTVVVDYAHTPDALENMLKTLSVFLKNDQKLITIVGCGGDRDKEKRPIMAKIAQAYSHQFILTSDNPRTEHPAAILKDMEQGLVASSSHKGITIEDRLQAIKTASLLANSGDIVLIAGKGHEKYQEVNGVKTPFDDFALAWESFNTKNQ
ncbi:MAG: hypothetical protein RIQ90_516 [Bacteroidota bacterium]|jgi:UDP-N-acetylmuramoyl-L-alanyl-D-glutamate--2,6-diaminopimelate ligase